MDPRCQQKRSLQEGGGVPGEPWLRTGEGHHPQTLWEKVKPMVRRDRCWHCHSRCQKREGKAGEAWRMFRSPEKKETSPRGMPRGHPGGGGREADPLPSDGQEAAFIVVTQDPGNALPPGHGAGKGVRTVPQVLHVGDITVSDQMRPPDWRPWENVRVPEGSERDPREGSGAPHQRETSGSRTEPLLGHNGKMTASRTLPHPIGKNFRRDICRAGDIGLIRILGFCLEAGRGGS